MTTFDQTQAELFFTLLGRIPASVRIRGINGKAVKGVYVPATVQAWMNDGYNVYAVINSGGDTKASITECIAYFAEWDDGSSYDVQLQRIADVQLPAPTFSVWTGGKSFHHYWVLDGAVFDIRAWQEEQKVLAALLKSDPSINDPSRVMRLPGTIHQATGQQVTVVGGDGKRVSPSLMRSLLAPPQPTLPAPQAPGPVGQGVSSGGSDERTRRAVLEQLQRIPQRIPGSGTRPQYLELLWSLVDLFGPDDAAALMTQHSPAWAAAEDLQAKAREARGDLRIASFFELARREWGITGQRAPRVTPMPPTIPPAPQTPQTGSSGGSGGSEGQTQGQAAEGLNGLISKPAMGKLKQQLQDAIKNEITGSDLEQLFAELVAEYGITHNGVRELHTSIEDGYQAAVDAAAQVGYLEAVRQQSAKRKEFKLSSIFPPDIAHAITLLSSNLQCDDFLAAMTVLTAASSCFKSGSQVWGDDIGFAEPPFIWLGIVGGSGTGKSHVYKGLAKNLLLSVRKEYERIYKEDMARFQAESLDGTAKGMTPPSPLLHDISNATPEAISLVLDGNQRYYLPALLMRDELSGIFMGMGQYKRNGGDDAQYFCSLYDGEVETTVRVSRGVTTVRGRVQIPMLGGIQPGVFVEIRERDDSIGLLARLLLCTMFDEHYKGNALKGVSKHEVVAAQDIMKGFYMNCFNLPIQPALRLCSQAQQAFENMNEAAWAHARQVDIPAHERIIGKRAGQVLRIAGIAHMINKAAGVIPPGDDIISFEHYQFAVRAINTCHGYALAAETRIQAGKEGVDVDIPDRLLRFIAKNANGASLAEFRRNALTPRQRAAYRMPQVQAIADELVKAKRIAVRKNASNNGTCRYVLLRA